MGTFYSRLSLTKKIYGDGIILTAGTLDSARCEWGEDEVRMNYRLSEHEV